MFGVEQAVDWGEGVDIIFLLDLILMEDGKVQCMVGYGHVGRRKEYDSQRRPLCKDKSTRLYCDEVSFPQ